MTFTIDPFVLGIICTIGSEILALFILAIIIGIKNSLNSRGNTSNSSRRDKNE